VSLDCSFLIALLFSLTFLHIKRKNKTTVGKVPNSNRKK
jgi:hypothetical protein